MPGIMSYRYLYQNEDRGFQPTDLSDEHEGFLVFGCYLHNGRIYIRLVSGRLFAKLDQRH